MLNAFRGLLGSRSGAQSSLTEHSMDMAPLGQVLVLSRPQAAITLKADAVAEMLHAQGDGRMRYAGVLLDFGGYGYRFSSADLGALLAAIAAWVRGWVAPCAIVLTGEAATELQRLLEITKVTSIEQLRIVATSDQAVQHIRHHLERRPASDR